MLCDTQVLPWTNWLYSCASCTALSFAVVGAAVVYCLGRSVEKAAHIVRQSVVEGAGIIGQHLEDGLKAHMATDGAGKDLLAKGVEHIRTAIADKRPIISLISFGRR